jgi:O-antigen/teichoic acid export membrane protein
MLNLGIAPANVYFIGRGEVGVRQALRTNLALWAALTGAGIVIGGFVIALKGDVWFPGVPVGYLWLAMVMFPMILLRDFTASLLQGVEDFLAYNKMMLAVPAVTLTTAAVTVGWLGWGVAGALAAVVGGSCAGVLVGSTALYIHPHGSDPSGEAKYARKCLGYGWKAHFSNALSFLNYRADVFLLNVLLAPAAVGVYVVAVQIGERLWVLSAAVSTVLLPRLSALHGEEDARRLITPLVSRWVLIVALAGAAVLAVFAGGIVRLLFGSEYLQAASALRWLLPGIAFVSASRVRAAGRS